MWGPCTTVLYGVLYDNQTAQDFAGMLPFTVDLWHPAPDFARAFNLPEYIPEYETSIFEEYGDSITIEFDEEP